MKSKRYIYQFLLLLALPILACGTVSSGPSTNEVKEAYMESTSLWYSETYADFTVESKTQCDTISTTSKAMGVSEAWFVAYSYDSSITENRASGTGIVSKRNGLWEFNIGGCP